MEFQDQRIPESRRGVAVAEVTAKSGAVFQPLRIDPPARGAEGTPAGLRAATVPGGGQHGDDLLERLARDGFDLS